MTWEQIEIVVFNVVLNALSSDTKHPFLPAPRMAVGGVQIYLGHLVVFCILSLKLQVVYVLLFSNEIIA